jgi:hypothetical protein
MNLESRQKHMPASNQMGLSDLSFRCWETIAVLALALGGNAAVAVADPAQLGPSTSECSRGTPIYQQDNKAGGHVTRHVSAYRLMGSDAAGQSSKGMTSGRETNGPRKATGIACS